LCAFVGREVAFLREGRVLDAPHSLRYAVAQMDDRATEGPRFVRRSPIAKVPRLCPNCLTVLTMGSGLGGWLIPQDYYCTKCGYKGYAFLEQERKDDPSPDRRGG
jgi:hypothetical protein